MICWTKYVTIHSIRMLCEHDTLTSILRSWLKYMIVYYIQLLEISAVFTTWDHNTVNI